MSEQNGISYLTPPRPVSEIQQEARRSTSAQAVADGYGHVCKMKELQKQQDREELKNQYSLFGGEETEE